MKIVSDVSANCVKCDIVGCPARFHSYSLHSVIRKQAKAEGWAKVGRGRLKKAFGYTDEQIDGGRSVDVCPDHAPSTKTSGKRVKMDASQAST